MEALKTASLFCDIGMLLLPQGILSGLPPLSPEEIRAIKGHPEQSVAVLYRIGILDNALPSIRHHHERYDGTGYPDGLVGSDIPLLARVICVADSFQAMTSPRPYRETLSVASALEQIERQANKQFDGHIASLLVKILKDQGKL